MSIVKHATRKTLTVYIHRDETERLISSIREVITNICKRSKIDRNETHCILNETSVIYQIGMKKNEIGFGSTEILTCNLYEAIEQNAPNMIFIHYKQVGKLQKLLAKHHCPELIQTPSNENVGKEKSIKAYLRLQRGGDVVFLEEWFEVKKHMLEYSLKLKNQVTCQAKTRQMEDTLFSCPDEVIKFPVNN